MNLQPATWFRNLAVWRCKISLSRLTRVMGHGSWGDGAMAGRRHPFFVCLISISVAMWLWLAWTFIGISDIRLPIFVSFKQDPVWHCPIARQINGSISSTTAYLLIKRVHDCTLRSHTRSFGHTHRAPQHVKSMPSLSGHHIHNFHFRPSCTIQQ